uniref:Uncharacterized protein n=1 Tax=Romanomermis culicivorax TaxID=13658 RepID=A0A915KAZ6_ROMCU
SVGCLAGHEQVSSNPSGCAGHNSDAIAIRPVDEQIVDKCLTSSATSVQDEQMLLFVVWIVEVVDDFA